MLLTLGLLCCFMKCLWIILALDIRFVTLFYGTFMDYSWAVCNKDGNKLNIQIHNTVYIECKDIVMIH